MAETARVCVENHPLGYGGAFGAWTGFGPCAAQSCPNEHVAQPSLHPCVHVGTRGLGQAALKHRLHARRFQT